MRPPGKPRYLGLAVGCIILASGCVGSSLPEKPVTPADAPVATAPAEVIADKATILPEPAANQAADIERRSIFFSLGSRTISHSERGNLKRLAQPLLNDRTLSVTLVGYTSDNGSPSLNLAIADGRLAEVSSALRKLGVKIQQIRRTVASEVDKSTPCRTTDCRKKMRRVEFIYSRPLAE